MCIYGCAECGTCVSVDLVKKPSNGILSLNDTMVDLAMHQIKPVVKCAKCGREMEEGLMVE